jgi:predicted ATPase/class 3 adenylate cyclase
VKNTISELPVGTLTFLMTDIEGSTRLWERDAAAMQPVLARHDSLVKTNVEKAGGQLVEAGREGDSALAVFGRARDAFACALRLQRALIREAWPEGVDLRVRLALHSGEAELRAGHYHGLAVYRCARLLAAGHGGQVLVSQATAELGRDVLPRAASLRELGLHRLKDLSRPEPVFQLLHPELPGDFPALRTLDRNPTNLPVQLSSFVGRERELSDVQELLSRSRLVTLTGAGGSGKTRLALQAAAGLRDGYPEGSWFVDLAPLGGAELLPQTIARALAIREEPARLPMETVVDHLLAKRVLLVLDNCEHLVEAAALAAETLLVACPRLSLLATSREPLKTAGEQVYRVSPMRVPDPAPTLDLKELVRVDAVHLFSDRAAMVLPTFAVTAQNAATVSQLCRRLDGIPLALELAAARVGVMTPADIVARLDDRFRLLASGKRTSITRQQTLLAALDWSYYLLAEPERTVFRRLAIFSGGFDLEAAAAVCADDAVPGPNVLNLLSALVEKSLLIAEESSLSRTRYRLLETLRMYARERMQEAEEEQAFRRGQLAGVRGWLAAALETLQDFGAEKLPLKGEATTLQDRHCRHYVALAEDRQPGALAEWLDRMESETDNLRSALLWALNNELELAARLVLALDPWWRMTTRVSEAKPHLETLLRERKAADSTRVRLLTQAGWYTHGAPVAAAELMDAALVLARALDEPEALIDTLLARGRHATSEGDLPRSELLLQEALEAARAIGDHQREAESLHMLGAAAGAKLNFAAARVAFERSLEIRRSLNRADEVAETLLFLAGIFGAEGDLKRARQTVAEALGLGRQLGDRAILHQALDVAAALAILEKEAERGVTLAAAADAALERIGWFPIPVWDHILEPYFQAGRQALGATNAAAAEHEGRQMTYLEAVEYALAWLTRPGTAHSS